MEVGIHAAEGELLSHIVAGLLEGIVVEVPVVAVVVEDLRAVLGGKCLKGVFGSENFGGCIVDWGWTKRRWLKWSTKMVAHL